MTPSRWYLITADDLHGPLKRLFQNLAPAWKSASPDQHQEAILHAIDIMLKSLSAADRALSSEVLAFSDNLAAEVRPEVEQARRDLFASPEPPFQDPAEATRWIEEQAENPPPLDLRPLLAEARALAQKWVEAIHATGCHDYRPEFGLPKRLLIAYPGEGTTKRLPAWTEKLARLAEASHDIAERTGWQEALATAHILWAALPLAPHIRVRRIVSQRPPELVLTVSAYHVSPALLFDAFANARGTVWQEPAERLRAEDRLLSQFLAANGGAPKGKRGEDTGVKRRWLELLELWNQAPPTGEHIDSWVTLKRRCERMQDKLAKPSSCEGTKVKPASQRV